MQVSVVAILVKNNTARDFERIVHMEPTLVEMQSFTIVEPVFVWAQLEGEPLQKLLYILGVEDDDHPRVLAAVSEADWDGAISKWSALAKPASPALKAKAVVAKGAAVLKTTGLRVGEQAPVSSIVPNKDVDWFGAGEVQFQHGHESVFGSGDVCSRGWRAEGRLRNCKAVAWCFRLRKNSQLNSSQWSGNSSRATFVPTWILLSGCRTEIV